MPGSAAGSVIENTPGPGCIVIGFQVLLNSVKSNVSPMGHDLSSHAARDAIDAKARALGFDAVGIARAKADTTQGQALQAFIADGRHGDMEWMQSTQERRSDPIALWPEAVSAVVVGVNYAPSVDPLAALGDRGRGVVSAYAQTGRDYHDVLKLSLIHI